jgi:predicted ATPase
VVVINGEAGIGKSRLLQELSGRLQQEHYTVLSGTTDELKPAFYVFASMIGEKADIDEVDPPETKKAKLQKTFSDLAGFSHRGLSRQDFSVEEDELYRRLPFIGTILFGLTYPGSLYEDIEPQLRYENLVEGLRLFLSYQKDPVCLIFDDLQWTKQEDRRAIRDLVRLLQSLSKKDISFILSKRPQLEEIELDPEVKIVNIDLQGLDNDSAADLALQMLEGLPLEESLDMVIKEKSEGNPFYLEQFLYYLREKGLIDKKNRQWVRTAAYRDEDLPENVFSMIMARIDQLEESAKESLRIASVVGFEFKELIIAAVMKIPVHEHILKTVNERLTYINNVIDLEYVFAHAVIKDVVYDSILRQKRAKIHRSIGDAIEKTYTDSLFDFHEALAYHYYHGQDWEKALAFAVSAGEKTRSAYRNEEALMYYERAIEIISEYLPQASEKLMVLHEQTGELYLTIGRYQDAERHYDEMLSASRDDILWQIRTLRLKATIKENMSQFDACVKLLDEAQALLASCEKTIDIQIEEALVNNVGCNVDRVKGNMQRAIQRGNDVIKQLRGIKTKKRDIKQRIDLACAGVIRSLCGIYYSLGQYETAIETYQEAQRIYEARADKCNIAATYGHMGLFYHGLHDYRRAIKLQKQCLDLHDELGHRRGAGIASGNLGLVYRDNGEYVKALECFERHLITSKELGDRLGEGIASANIGAVHHYKGDYDSALEYYDHHRVISEKLGDKFGLARACENIGAIHFVRGEFLAASEHFVKQLSAFQLIGNKEGVANACVNLSQSSIKTGKYHEAQKFLEKAEQLYDDINATFALSQVYCGFAEVFFKAGEDHDRALQYAEKAYALSKETDNDLDKIHALLISAQILEKCGKDDGVAGCYRDALRLSEKMGSKYDLAETHFLFGKYLGRKDDPRAVEHFASAEQGFMDMKLQNRLKEAQDCRENQH